MDYDKISAPDFGRSLSGLGLNLLVRDVPRMVAFLKDVFGMTAHQASRDFAILRYGVQVFQLHSDPTFANHPLTALLPEAGPRGAGIELRLYETDPDAAVAAAGPPRLWRDDPSGSNEQAARATRGCHTL